MKIFHTIFILLSLTQMAFSEEDWAVDTHAYGGGDSEGIAYKKGEQIVTSELNVYRNKCEKSEGEYSMTLRRGFCTPYDPNDLFNKIECLVRGRGLCKLPVFKVSISTNDEEGNKNDVIEPGETISVLVTIQNQKSVTEDALTLTTSLAAENSLVEILNQNLSFGEIPANSLKTKSLKIKLSPNFPCGDELSLKFDLVGLVSSRSSTQTLTVGQNVGKVIVLSEEDINLPLGQSYPIEVDAPEEAKVYKVRLKYTARVNYPAHYRTWLTAPEGKNSWAYYNNESRQNLTFDEDLTAKFQGAAIKGTWHLSGDMANGNAGSFTSYRLSIVPREFKCEKN